MPVKPTTSDPGTEREPGDFHYGFRHAMGVAESETVFRCDGHFLWGDEEADHLNWLCKKLADTLKANPADSFTRDVQAGFARDTWRQLREKWGYTLRDAADEIDVDASTLSRWETGERKPDPTKPNARRYKQWLEQRWGSDVAYWRTHVFLECAVRDAWHPDEWQGRQQITDQWERMYDKGGWYDTWLQTGVLPDTNPGTRFDGILKLRAEQEQATRKPRHRVGLTRV